MTTRQHQGMYKKRSNSLGPCRLQSVIGGRTGGIKMFCRTEKSEAERSRDTPSFVMCWSSQHTEVTE
jgi:hypothetical protein